jgi:hypothetical protein
MLTGDDMGPPTTRPLVGPLEPLRGAIAPPRVLTRSVAFCGNGDTMSHTRRRYTWRSTAPDRCVEFHSHPSVVTLRLVSPALAVDELKRQRLQGGVIVAIQRRIGARFHDDPRGSMCEARTAALSHSFKPLHAKISKIDRDLLMRRCDSAVRCGAKPPRPTNSPVKPHLRRRRPPSNVPRSRFTSAAQGRGSSAGPVYAGMSHPSALPATAMKMKT